MSDETAFIEPGLAVTAAAVESPRRIGWLGLGAMGFPMARRLLESGYRVAAFDPSSDRRRSLGPGVVSASSPAEAAVGNEALLLMVATASQADEALFGSEGAARHLQAGSRVMILGTLGPAWVRSLPSRLPAGVRVVDAPVSGGVSRAVDGSLLIMASAANAEDRALLSLLGDPVTVGDEPGMGQSMKMVNQVLCGVHIAAAAEALALAESLGIEPARAWETVRRGAAASFMLDDRGGRMVEPSDGQVRSAVSLFVKDLGLVMEEAGASRQPLSVVAAAEQLFAAAAASGRGDSDDSELFDYVRTLKAKTVAD